VPELAAYLRVHPTTVYRLLNAGRIPGFRVGDEWRISADVIEHWQQNGGNARSPRRRKG
jgi:excisionase family DNA binding protein